MNRAQNVRSPFDTLIAVVLHAPGSFGRPGVAGKRRSGIRSREHIEWLHPDAPQRSKARDLICDSFVLEPYTRPLPALLHDLSFHASSGGRIVNQQPRAAFVAEEICASVRAPLGLKHKAARMEVPQLAFEM